MLGDRAQVDGVRRRHQDDVVAARGVATEGGQRVRTQPPVDDPRGEARPACSTSRSDAPRTPPPWPAPSSCHGRDGPRPARAQGPAGERVARPVARRPRRGTAHAVPGGQRAVDVERGDDRAGGHGRPSCQVRCETGGHGGRAAVATAASPRSVAGASPSRSTTDALVLDVGSGDKPHWRADVLARPLRRRRVRRSALRPGRGRISRPLFDADAAAMPFADKVFDYVVCSHVLEHVPDPAAVVAEMTRVGRAGYIEVPEAASAKILDFPSHLWWCRSRRVDAGVHAEAGAGVRPRDRRLHRAGRRRAAARQAARRRVRLPGRSSLRWTDRVDVRVEGPADPAFVAGAARRRPPPGRPALVARALTDRADVAPSAVGAAGDPLRRGREARAAPRQREILERRGVPPRLTTFGAPGPQLPRARSCLRSGVGLRQQRVVGGPEAGPALRRPPGSSKRCRRQRARARRTPWRDDGRDAWRGAAPCRAPGGTGSMCRPSSVSTSRRRSCSARRRGRRAGRSPWPG